MGQLDNPEDSQETITTPTHSFSQHIFLLLIVDPTLSSTPDM